ncbi:MAG: fasciclin domain-containing protein [Carboxylicivirga sp.]|nr:fasciclin domain-containing protein [Carboxylicivirga sp.]
MKNILITFIGIGLLWACTTKDNYIDTGVSSPYYDGDMFEYFHSNSYDWDSVIVMIEHGGLVDLFEGNDNDLEEFTFLGPTNHSIRRYLILNNLDKVSDLSPEECNDFIMAHVIKGKYLKKDFPFRNMENPFFTPGSGDGLKLASEGGNELIFYKEPSDYAGVKDAGPVKLFIHSIDKNKRVPVASPDIQPDNGVVIALNYSYTLGEI